MHHKANYVSYVQMPGCPPCPIVPASRQFDDFQVQKVCYRRCYSVLGSSSLATVTSSSRRTLATCIATTTSDGSTTETVHTSTSRSWLGTTIRPSCTWRSIETTCRSTPATQAVSIHRSNWGELVLSVASL